jgi:hypothetical protein
MSVDEFKAATPARWHRRNTITAIDKCLQKIAKSPTDKNLLNELLNSIDTWLGKAAPDSERRPGTQKLRDQVVAEIARIDSDGEGSILTSETLKEEAPELEGRSSEGEESILTPKEEAPAPEGRSSDGEESESILTPETLKEEAPAPEGRSSDGEESESILTPEDKVRKAAHTLKFNFAGSGQKLWNTRKDKYASKDQEQMPEVKDHASGGIKYSKEKKTEDREKLVFEYAGPLATSGVRDSGENSTQANLADAKIEFIKFMKVAKEHNIKAVQINIKGFSRGAATASVFASWIKGTDYKDIVNVNLLLFDPVHGTSNWTGVATGYMPSEQDVSGVYEEAEAPDTSGTTIVMPVVSGHWGDGFTPQMISGYQRIIIVYGPGAEHGSGILGEKNEKTPLKYGGEKVKGMQLTTNLPKGLCVVNTADMNIIHVSSMAEWETFADTVLGQANKREKRDIVIQNALSRFLPS